VIVLDTHVLVWWVNGDGGLSAAAERAIAEEMGNPDGLILVSSISAWEIALLIQRGRLLLSTNLEEWLSAVQEIPAVRFVPVNNDIGVQSTRLPDEFHPDPADRIIVALARHMAVPLVTADARIRAYPHVRTIW